MDKFDKIMQSLENLNKRISNIENILSMKKPEISIIQNHKKAGEESFIEFFRKYKVQKDTDKTLVIMYFLESEKNMSSITTKDISKGFKEIREKTPANVSDKVQLLHKKGLIMPGDLINNLRGWMLTRTGLDYLEELKNEKSKEEK